jgi:hypothetical protein
MEDRWKQHIELSQMGGKRSMCKTIKLWNALRKYGPECWNHQVLIVVADEQIAKTQEIHLIEQYNTYHKGYNSTKGGDGFRGTHTEIARQKISEASRQSACRRREQGIKNKRNPHSSDTKHKISMGHDKQVILLHEDGRMLTVILRHWCKEQGVSIKTLYFAHWKNRSVKRGPLKGWSICVNE